MAETATNAAAMPPEMQAQMGESAPNAENGPDGDRDAPDEDDEDEGSAHLEPEPDEET